MMDGAKSPKEQALHEAAVRYCEAVWYARTEVFAALCHERFNMTLVEGEKQTYWDKTSFIARVAARQPFEGPASFEIYDMDIAGDEIARVHLWVDVPPHRYEDHLGFVQQDGEWILLTKVFRVKEILDGEGRT